MGLSNFTTPDEDDQANGQGVQPSAAQVHAMLLQQQQQQSPPGGADDAVLEMLIDYTQLYATADPTMYRDALIQQTLTALISKNKRNVMLIGEAGVGKTKIVEDIARRIALGDLLIPSQLADHKVYELPLTNLMAGTGLRGMLEEKMKALVEFATNPDNKVILFIDEIHLLVGDSDGSYSKIAQILKPALARGDMRLIGATTTQESRDLDNDPAFVRRFTHLTVDELTSAQTFEVLQSVRPVLMKHYGYQVTLSNEVLQEVVSVADRQSHAGSHRPDNAITLLDRAMADRVLEQQRLISDAATSGNALATQALKSMPNFPLTENKVRNVAQRLLTGQSVKHEFVLADLERELKANIQGQDAVLDVLLDRFAREDLNLFPRSTPLAALFAGASGVGKTETAKLLAKHVTGQPPIILNMTEYNSPSSISRIIGSSAGYVGYDSNAELPFDTLQSNPHRVVLLDEFEKSDISVQRLFLSALDEGFIKTSRGRTINFSKAIVIATTNAAREALSGTRAGFGQSTEVISARSLTKALTQSFDAELLGRFSLTVGFNPINEAKFREIAAKHYLSVRASIVASKPSLAALLPVAIDDDELVRISAESYIDSQGARPARKAVRTWVENLLLTPSPAAVPVLITGNAD